jgi:hypothetical protein
LGYTWTKLRLQAAGLIKKAERRSAHRKKRPRRPLAGMLLHQDGAPHRWLPALDAELDPIVTLDDATSALYPAFLVDEEGTLSTFRALAEVIAAHGLPSALYRPRAPRLCDPQGGGEGRQGSAHPGRPGARPARDRAHPGYSPEARGRSERAFGTLQDRLPKALALAGITTVAAANRFLRAVDLPEHNARFAIAPEHPETAFVVDRAGAHRDLLCVQRSAWSATTTPCATAA